MEKRLKGGWGFLRVPSARDVTGPRKRRKALDLPPREFDYLVVMDFEWTCDNKPGTSPPEIIEFPAVLVQLRAFPPTALCSFRSYVRPQINPTLTEFCKSLTAIKQEDVDSASCLVLGGRVVYEPLMVKVRCYSDHQPQVLQAFHHWLIAHGLWTSTESPPKSDGEEDEEQGSCVTGEWKRFAQCCAKCPSRDHKAEKQHPGSARFAIVTWGDADVMSVLDKQCRLWKLEMPEYFRRWINLKTLFKQCYRREASGGLQRCVESLGLEFEGRAHSGLVDSHNTAKIVCDMRTKGFRFTRTTRGFDASGRGYGQKQAQ